MDENTQDTNLDQLGSSLIQELAKEVPQLPLSDGSIFNVDWTDINHVAVACYAIAMNREMEQGFKNALNMIGNALGV